MVDEDEVFNDPGRMLKEGNISLILESYNDLFSDFDPRNYSERTISDDFLIECKRAIRDKPSEEFELRLLMPKTKRNLSDEFKIKKRLKDHFQKHVSEKQKEVNSLIRNGLLMAAIGFVFMISGAWFIFTKFLEGTFLAAVLTIILEPAGWFFFWEGLAKTFFIYEEHERKKRDLDFYRKMSRAQIYFLSY
jgi:hypothetical protein